MHLVDTNNVSITLSGLQVTSRNPNPKTKTGTCVVSASPIRRMPGSKNIHASLYFEIVVTAVVPTQNRVGSGLGIGVTSTPPASIRKTPTAKTIPGSVLFGYDGVCVHNSPSGSQKIYPDQWKGSVDLEVGTVIGVFCVMPAGDLVLVVNGDVVADLCDSLPVDGSPLWAVVDLDGNTNSVKWVPNPTVSFSVHYLLNLFSAP